MKPVRLSDEQLSVVWSPERHDPEWKRDYLTRLREVCSSSGNGVGEWLCGQRALRSFPVRELRALESRLDSATLRNTLREVTLRARAFNPSLPIARVAIEYQRAPNPINPDRYTAENLSASRALVESLETAIRSDLEAFSSHARVGLLLLSGAYYGGLLDIPQLNALARLEPGRIVWITGIPEVRLRLSIRGQPEAEQRQWFPDPTTLALLSRCAADLAGLRPELGKRGVKLQCIQAVLLAVGMRADCLPMTLERLFELLRMQLQIHLPQMLVNYATRSGYVTHPVLAGSWPLMHGHSSVIDEVERSSKKRQLCRGAGEAGPEWLQRLCRDIRKKRLVVSEQHSPPRNLEELICQWAAYLLHGRSFYGNALQPKTVANYVRDVGRGLVDQLTEEPILEVPPDALEGLYELMLEAQPTRAVRRNLSKALLEFHGFLQKAFAYPPVSPYAVLGIGKFPQFVDAQILTEDQYRDVLRRLSVGPLAHRSPRMAVIAQAMVILGFRLGLRRNEALKLLRRDLQLPLISAERAAAVHKRHPALPRLSPERLEALELEVSLHIRPHAQRCLKTRNSTRTLPLRLLLEPDELRLITELAQQRDAEEAKCGYSEYLFCVPELQTRWVSESSLFPVIHEALRSVTGHSELHYHHLRHSCATWLMFKLATAAWGVSERVELLFGQHRHTAAWLRSSDRLARTFFHSEGAPTRRVIHITSALLGHSSPKISLLHYIHCMPWLLALCWQWNPAHWPAGHVVATIAQVSLPTKPADGHIRGLPAELAHMRQIIKRIRPYKAVAQPLRPRRQTQAQSGVEGTALARINQVAVLLAYEAFAEATGHSVNLDWIEFPEIDRLAMLDRARYIRSIGRHRLRGPASGNQWDQVELAPRPPKHGGLDGIAVYAEALYQLLGGAGCLKACRVLDDFVERCWSSDTTLRFYPSRDEQSAREYLWLLDKIGIDQQHIELISYDSNKPRRTKMFWRKALGRARLKFSEQRPENPLVENTHIGIRAQFRLPHPTGQGEILNQHSGAALRYLFLMASIDWHFRA